MGKTRKPEEAQKPAELSRTDHRAVVSKKPSKKAERLTIFIREYLVHRNGTKAAIAAGCSEKSAAVTASRWLRNAKVREQVDKKTEERCEKLDIKADRVLAELAKLGFANMLDYLTIHGGDAYVDFSRLTREQGAAIQEVTSETYMEAGDGDDKVAVKRTKFKLADKRGSLELLGKHLKLFTENLEIGGTGFTLINKVTSPKRQSV